MTLFKIGDTVIANDKEPEMTVLEIYPTYLVCEWQDEEELCQNKFNPWELKIVRMSDE